MFISISLVLIGPIIGTSWTFKKIVFEIDPKIDLEKLSDLQIENSDQEENAFSIVAGKRKRNFKKKSEQTRGGNLKKRKLAR